MCKKKNTLIDYHGERVTQRFHALSPGAVDHVTRFAIRKFRYLVAVKGPANGLPESRVRTPTADIRSFSFSNAGYALQTHRSVSPREDSFHFRVNSDRPGNQEFSNTFSRSSKQRREIDRLRRPFSISHTANDKFQVLVRRDSLSFVWTSYATVSTTPPPHPQSTIG